MADDRSALAGSWIDGEVVGTWRPKTVSKKLTVQTDLWCDLSRPKHKQLVEQAERLAAHRDVALADLVT